MALDVGCSVGGVGYALRRRFPDCALWGCELDAKAAELARQHFDQVIQQDVENLDLKALGLEKPFDLICLLDVLEHLFNPWMLLQGLHRIATDDAQVLVSLPNASNLPLLYDAVRGHWRYRDQGLLDFTHLRFFTDFDARKMFYQTGWRMLKHHVTFLGTGGNIFEAHRNATFPMTLTLGEQELSVRVASTGDLIRLCADQNIYLLAPHHDQLDTEYERNMASTDYPVTYAFGMG